MNLVVVVGVGGGRFLQNNTNYLVLGVVLEGKLHLIEELHQVGLAFWDHSRWGLTPSYS